MEQRRVERARDVHSGSQSDCYCVSMEMASKLKSNKFSVIIEEDVSTTKCFTVIVKYYDLVTRIMKTGSLELIDVCDDDKKCVGSIGEH